MDFSEYVIKITESFGYWGYLIAFMLAFLESLAFIGGFIPGTSIIVLLGFMCYKGYMNIYFLMFITILGAVIGDSISYWLGTKGTHFFKSENKFLKASHLDMGQKFFEKHGNKSIFLGRFVGIIRPMIPFAAGLSRMNYNVFLFWNIFSGIVWAAFHIYLGYFFGGAFKLIETWSARVSVFILVLIVGIVLLWLLARAFIGFTLFALRSLERLVNSMLETAPAKLFSARFPQAACFLGRRFKKSLFTGLPLSLVILAALTSLVLFLVLADGILDADPIVDIDQRVSLFFMFFRDLFLIKVFLWISLFGKFQIICASSFAVFAVMMLWRKKAMIWPCIGILAFCETLLLFISESFTRPRPNGVIPAYLETNHSFPCEPAALSLLFYGLICYLLVRLLFAERLRLAIWTIFTSLLFVAMIGFSSLYLGVNYFSDVIGGWLLGGICLLAGISLYEWLIQARRQTILRHSARTWPKRVLNIFFVSAPFAFLLYYGNFVFRPELIRGSEISVTRQLTVKSSPKEIFASSKWPKTSLGLSGRHREPISLMIWARDEQQILGAFVKAGWKIPDQPSLKNIAKKAFAALEGKPYDSAPIVPIFWINQANDLAFEKAFEKSPKQMHRVRFWKTDIIDQNGLFLYVGASEKTVKKGILDVAAERSEIIEDLEESAVIRSMELEELGGLIKSSDRAFAIRYFSDGMVAVIILK